MLICKSSETSSGLVCCKLQHTDERSHQMSKQRERDTVFMDWKTPCGNNVSSPSNWYTDLMQSLSNSQQDFFLRHTQNYSKTYIGSLRH